MKKKLAILLSITMVLMFTFAACGGGGNQDLSDSKYLGEWVADSISFGDTSGGFEGAEWKLTLNPDGTGTFVAIDTNGTEDVSNINWQLTSDGFKTTGDTKLKFEDEDGGIETKTMGVELHFIRPADDGADSSAETDPVNGAKFGYSGDDPVQAAVYQYLIESVAPQYDPPEGAVSIPIVQLMNEEIDNEDGEAEVEGDFWIFNYVIEGDTLKMVSGGNHPGQMELIQAGSGYAVTEFEQVGDGSNFEPTARDIFEERYDMFMKFNSDKEAQESLRAQIIGDYVKANGLSVTKYQDEGWDPIDIPL